MVNSRDKGTRGEYAVIKLIEELLGIKLKRDVEQYRQADRGDLILAEDADWPFCVEVKSYSGLSVTHRPAWWQQVEKASAAHGLIPVLFYKYDRYEWRVVLKANTVSFALGGTTRKNLRPTHRCAHRRGQPNEVWLGVQRCRGRNGCLGAAWLGAAMVLRDRKVSERCSGASLSQYPELRRYD